MSKFPNHLPEGRWTKIELEMKTSERVPLEELMLLTGANIEVGEFRQRKKIVVLIYRKKKPEIEQDSTLLEIAE